MGASSASTACPSECVEALQPAVGEEAVRLDSAAAAAAASCGAEVGQHGLVLPLRRLAPVFLLVVPTRTHKIELVFVLRSMAF